MKVLLAIHGYPPEMHGGTEHSVQQLAHGLLRAGHEVVVVAGSDDWQRGFRVSRARDQEPVSGRAALVLRIHRSDLFYGNWQKALSPRVGAAFQQILRDERPDVVHVHHWIRLTRDLVARAAAERVPAVLTLHDYWSSCLVYFRVRPSDRRYCDAPLAPDPCLACAGAEPPQTSWRSPAELAASLVRHRAELLRELQLARAVFVLSEDQGRAVRAYSGLRESDLDLRISPPARATSPERRRELRAPPRPGEPLRIGCWGGLHWLKGTDLLVDAIAELSAGGVQIELHLAGSEADAPFVARLRERARGLPVAFHGAFPEGALPRHAVSDVHAFATGTRARETWGIAVDEALALGLPVVVPRFGALPEHAVEGRGALWYESGDVRSLAGALRRLAAEPGLLARLAAEVPDPSTVFRAVEGTVADALAAYRAACARGAPSAPAFDPVVEGDDEALLGAWDAELKRRTAEELGFA